MKYALTGSAGHISKPIAEKLLAADHEVRVIGRKPDHLQPLVEQGATAAIGSVEDVDFLKNAFAGADAVYTMVPPFFDATDWKAWIGQIGKNYAEAIRANEIKYVVNLSSIGAHLPDGCGPVTGMHRTEQALNTLKDVNIKHLRPGYFYHNYLASVPMMKQTNVLGGNFGDSENRMILADTDDIAEVAAEALLHLNFTGHSVHYIACDEQTNGDIAKILGAAVGKPELPWIEFSDKDTLAALKQAGLPEEIAINYTEMGAAIRSGIFFEDYNRNQPEQLGKTKLEDFAKVFATVYKEQS